MLSASARVLWSERSAGKREGPPHARDAWGGPWIYVAPGPGRQQPDRRTSYDLYSVGPDGKTGDSWNAAGNAFELPPDDPASFYRQAADDPKDGDAASGARYSADDIANF